MFTINLKRSARLSRSRRDCSRRPHRPSHALSTGATDASGHGWVKAPVSSDSWGTTHPTHSSSLNVEFDVPDYAQDPDSSEVQVESLKAGSSEVLVETVTLVAGAGTSNTNAAAQAPGIWAPGDGSDFVKGIWAPGDGSDF